VLLQSFELSDFEIKITRTFVQIHTDIYSKYTRYYIQKYYASNNVNMSATNMPHSFNIRQL